MNAKRWGVAWLAALMLAVSGCDYGPDEEAGWCNLAASCQAGAGGGATAGAVVSSGFFRSGTGDAVLQLPATVTVVQLLADPQAPQTLFSARADDRLLVLSVWGGNIQNQAIRGTYKVPAGARMQLRAADVAWTLSSALITPPPENGALFDARGRGEMVLMLPARDAVYRLTGQAAEERPFSVWADGDVVTVQFLEAGRGFAYSGQHALKAGQVIEIRSATHVDWRITEQR